MRRIHLSGSGFRRSSYWLLASLTLIARAQDTETSPDLPEPVEVETPPPASDVEPPPPAETAPSGPVARPKYYNLRYDDDFTYLENPPEDYKPDLFDPIKHVYIDDDFRLSLGGEIRFRYESETNKFLQPGSQQYDSFLLTRAAVFADLKYRKLARLFVEGIEADVIDRDERLFFIHRNRGDLHQLFADVRILGEETPLTLRLGRQELVYGVERVISATGWGRIRKRFDGVKLIWDKDPWRIDAWWSRPVIIETTAGDDWDEDADFSGIYFTYKGIPRHGLDLYFLSLDDRNERVNANGNTGGRDIYTVGSRFFGKTAGFDYDAEYMHQWGHLADDRVDAWSAGGTLGYTFSEWQFQPRLGGGFELASGDRDPNDEVVNTYDQLYRQEKEHLGYLVLFGRQNITSLNSTMGLWLVPKKVKLDLFYYAYWLTEETDSVYNPGGFPIPARRDPDGDSGAELGHEFDITLGWQIDVHSSILLGYSQFWSDGFIHATGDGDEPAVWYVQYQFQF